MSDPYYSAFSDQLRDVLREFGYEKPTPIQQLLLSVFGSAIKKNLLVVAPTGSGKTEAVVFPVVDWLIRKNESCKRCIKVLYITPLRALNRDIFERLFPILEDSLNISIDVRHGDTSSYQRAKQSRRPPKFLITTPETLQAILVSPNLRKALRSLEWVIVDEVHSLFDSKRGVQLAVGLERLRRISKDFNVIGLSATVSNAEEVLDYLTGGRGGEIVKTEGEKEYEVKIDSILPTTSDDKEEVHLTGNVDVHGIARRIAKYLNETDGKVLVFTNTRDLAEILGLLLRKYTNKPYAVHHSSLSKDVRVKVEQEFKKGDLKCIIATSSLELGIDIGTVELVIQVMSPRRVETMLQRIGRAGHRYEKVSRGVIITATPDDLLESLAIIELSKLGFLEPVSFFEKNYDVLAHQIVGIVRDFYLDGVRGVTPEEIYRIVKRSYPYKNLNLSEFLRVLDFLEERSGVIRLDNGLVKLTRRSIRYYFENLSTIPTTVKYVVRDISERGKKVGELDSKFVLEINKGDVFLLAGVPREVVDIDYKSREVIVIGSSIEGKPPAWVGELLPVSLEVGLKVGAIRRALVSGGGLEGQLSENLTDEALALYLASRSLFSEGKPVPSDRTMLIEIDVLGGVVVIHAPFGNKVNNTLSTLLAYLIVEKNNIPYLSFENDAYRIIFRFDRNLMFNQNFVERVLEESINMAIDLFLFDRDGSRVEEILRDALIEFRINELAWFLINVLKRFGLLWDESTLTKKQILKLISAYRGSVVLEEAAREMIQSKMDLNGARKILQKIDSGEMDIWFSEGLSPIAIQGNAYSNVVIRDVDRYVEERYEKTLLNRTIKTTCLMCGEEVVEKVHSAPKKCPRCGSKNLAITKKWEEVGELLDKVARKVATREELDKFNDLLTFSKYYAVYGETAALAMAARGMSLKRAISILRRYASNRSLVVHHARKVEINYMKSKPIIEKKYI